MAQEELKIGEDGTVDFDFGFDNFRPMGFTFDGLVLKASIEKPEKESYSFTDKRTGNTITKPAKPQLVLLVQPTDHTTRSGNPYPEYFQLTHNSRSKLGVFMEHLQKLGIRLGSDPSILEGKEFTWERKEVQFGGIDPIQVLVPIAMTDALSEGKSGGGAAPKASSNPFDALGEDILNQIAEALDGKSSGDAVTAVSRSVRSPQVIAGVVDGSLIDYLVGKGLINEAGDRYARVPSAA